MVSDYAVDQQFDVVECSEQRPWTTAIAYFRDSLDAAVAADQAQLGPVGDVGAVGIGGRNFDVCRAGAVAELRNAHGHGAGVPLFHDSARRELQWKLSVRHLWRANVGARGNDCFGVGKAIKLDPATRLHQRIRTLDVAPDRARMVRGRARPLQAVKRFQPWVGDAGKVVLRVRRNLTPLVPNGFGSTRRDELAVAQAVGKVD